jgi:hypothetical protein
VRVITNQYIFAKCKKERKKAVGITITKTRGNPGFQAGLPRRVRLQRQSTGLWPSFAARKSHQRNNWSCSCLLGLMLSGAIQLSVCSGYPTKLHNRSGRHARLETGLHISAICRAFGFFSDLPPPLKSCEVPAATLSCTLQFRKGRLQLYLAWRNQVCYCAHSLRLPVVDAGVCRFDLNGECGVGTGDIPYQCAVVTFPAEVFSAVCFRPFPTEFRVRSMTISTWCSIDSAWSTAHSPRHQKCIAFHHRAFACAAWLLLDKSFAGKNFRQGETLPSTHIKHMGAAGNEALCRVFFLKKFNCRCSQ